MSEKLESRTLKGALIDLCAGAEVVNVQSSSDRSAMPMLYMQPHYDIEALQSYLNILEETLPLSCIRTSKEYSGLPVVANIEVKDPKFTATSRAKVGSISRDSNSLESIQAHWSLKPTGSDMDTIGNGTIYRS
ncbi:hypothetical protein N7G274_003338 [Stereocaulon virgatum]|uniref:Uncharacterized protein n=1 Tax=Stereocaulon virgatum TaxID=373712 RepID=A0ABR4AFG2_9LECA